MKPHPMNTQNTKSIPNCPVCNGERELNGLGGYVCYFCGTSTPQNTQEWKVKHTLGHWSVFGCTIYQDDCWNAGHNEGGQRICSTYSGSPEEERDEMPTDTQSANAEFIAKACNAHEELLCACKVALATVERLEVKHGPFSSVQGTKDVLNAAIQKAEVQS